MYTCGWKLEINIGLTSLITLPCFFETVLLIEFTNLAKLAGQQTSAILLSRRSQYWDGRPCATTLSFSMCSEYPCQVPTLAPQAHTEQFPGPRM